MFASLCDDCRKVGLADGRLRSAEECTKGHAERPCEWCSKPVTGGCSDLSSSGDYVGHARVGWDKKRVPADACYGSPVLFDMVSKEWVRA